MFNNIRFSFILLIGFSFIGCTDDAPSPNGPASLSINNIKFSGELLWTFLDLPDGVYQPDDPNFHPDRPETWTGNMAQYVKRIYRNTVEYTITNSKSGTAYDTEVDLFYKFSNGDDEVVTLFLGNIAGNSTSKHSTTVNSSNSQLNRCTGEVYWYE